MMFVNILQVRFVAAPYTVTWPLALSGHGIVVAFNSNHFICGFAVMPLRN